MFRREPEQLEGLELVEATAIDTYQRASDPNQEAPEFINRIRQELFIHEVHPWHAPNTTQIQLIMAHIALFTDRTAEILSEDGKVETRKGERLPADVATFAFELSKIAIDQFDKGRQVAPDYGKNDLEFSDEWRNVLAPEAQLPYWPAFPMVEELPEWQSYELSGLSTSFLRGIVRAARWIHSVVDEDLRGLTGPSAPMAIPTEYEQAGIPTYIWGRIQQADIDLTTAERLVGGVSTLPDAVKQDAYVKAHDAYVNMIQAALLTVTPQLLGSDFAPQR